jgi:protein-S-isoprenylcysteine O-methyltransferase Ste14
MGIGHKVGLIMLPWLAFAIFFSTRYGSSFAFFEDVNKVLFFIGLALLITGSIMYLLTIPSLLIGLKNTKLITTGTFYLCCNPLYASIILLIIPGISLMMNSWLVLTTSLVGFVLLKIFIKSEYVEMEKFFGDEYRKYKDRTPEFFPFPLKKIFRPVRDVHTHDSFT